MSIFGAHLCMNCFDDPEMVLEHCSFEEFRSECWKPTQWSYEVFDNASSTIYGRDRQGMVRYTSCWKDPMAEDIRRTKVFRNTFRKKITCDNQDVLSSIAALFE